MVLDNPSAHNRECNDAHSDHPADKGKNLAAELWKGLENNSDGRSIGAVRQRVKETVLDFGAHDPYESRSSGDTPGKATVGTAKPDHASCEAAADAIDKACNQGIYGIAGTDKEVIYKVLEGKTEAERK